MDRAIVAETQTTRVTPFPQGLKVVEVILQVGKTTKGNLRKDRVGRERDLEGLLLHSGLV
jgi:hypothetical protein